MDDMKSLVEQALFEVEDLIACADDEGEGDTEFTQMLPVLRQIEAGLRELDGGIVAGTYSVGGNQDLPLMSAVGAVRKRLPVSGLLGVINRAHKSGFEA